MCLCSRAYKTYKKSLGKEASPRNCFHCCTKTKTRDKLIMCFTSICSMFSNQCALDNIQLRYILPPCQDQASRWVSTALLILPMHINCIAKILLHIICCKCGVVQNIHLFVRAPYLVFYTFCVINTWLMRVTHILCVSQIPCVKAYSMYYT